MRFSAVWNREGSLKRVICAGVLRVIISYLPVLAFCELLLAF